MENLSYGMIGQYRSVTDGRMKLVHDLKGGTWQLFDLARDPGERTDVKAQQRPDFARLRQALLAWLATYEGKGGLQRAQEAEQRLRALGYL